MTERLWCFDTFHQDDTHERLTQDGPLCRLSVDQVLIHNDFGSKRKKRTSRYQSLPESRADPSYSTELHQEYSHVESLSSQDNVKLCVTRHYFIADDCTQDGSQAVCNKRVVLKSVKNKQEDLVSGIYLSDGGQQ